MYDSETLENNFRDAWKKLKSASDNKGRQSQHEQNYGLAYKALYAVGARPKIKSKYQSNYSPGHAKG